LSHETLAPNQAQHPIDDADVIILEALQQNPAIDLDSLVVDSILTQLETQITNTSNSEVLALETDEFLEQLAGSEAHLSDDIAKDLKRKLRGHKLLTAEQEVELSYQIEAGVFARAALDGEFSPGTATEAELTEITRIGANAKEQMIYSNLRLVLKNASRYNNRGVEFIDLVQEGMLGVQKAVEKFDATKGYKFSTYAMWWIRQSMLRSIAISANMIDLPMHVTDEINRYTAVVNDRAYDGSKLSKEKISELSGLSVDKIKEIENILHQKRVISLNAPVGEDAAGEFGDLITSNDDNDSNLGHALEQSSMIKLFLDKLEQLNPVESQIVTLTYGLKDGNSLPTEQIAIKLGLPAWRVKGICEVALSKLRADSDFVDSLEVFNT
jgi:RNA polymerase primary sigma factor